MHRSLTILTGNGKGKTTAGLGACLRFAGSGNHVLYTQFLKNDASSELHILKRIPQVTFLPSQKTFGFSFRMSETERRLAAEHYTAYLKKIIAAADTGTYDILVLDEIFAADSLQFIPHETLLSFLKRRPLHMILTGRNPAPDIIALADAMTDIHCVKHPFSRGIPARTGIEK